MFTFLGKIGPVLGDVKVFGALGTEWQADEMHQRRHKHDSEQDRPELAGAEDLRQPEYVGCECDHHGMRSVSESAR